MQPSRVLAPLLALGLLATPCVARAFSGFYVAGADSGLHSDATMVVLMRQGTRTALSMRSHYQGPLDELALVVPVPEVLRKDDVKVLPDEVFDRVDRLTAPRLVEYWEQDPCEWHYPSYPGYTCTLMYDRVDQVVKIEAKFDVGEYNVVILSARESAGLQAWLEREGYAVSPSAEPQLRPYVQAGMKFFVAKVDPSKVQRDAQGRTMLSPLRFHYDSKEFALPIRLGSINADPDAQHDLIVHILARGTRYEVANYENVAIPTNLDVEPGTRERFDEFYAALFDATLARHPGAVITEYAWSAGDCDPCPTHALTQQELLTLGLDVLGPPTHSRASKTLLDERAQQSEEIPNPVREQQDHPYNPQLEGWVDPGPHELVLTRLHLRYDAGSPGEDLIFRAAPPIVGGVEVPSRAGQLDHQARLAPEEVNKFQARYAIRHRWPDRVKCANPQYGYWRDESGDPGYTAVAAVARDLAFVERAADLAGFLTEASAHALEQARIPLPEPAIDPRASCAHCSTEPTDPGGLLALPLGLLVLGRIRRGRS